jgi:hypothetical protein
MNDPVTVYVELVDEGVDTWRPVQAEHVGGDRYRLTGARPDGEVWPFAVGDIVRCKAQRLSADWGRRAPVLVAYERST